MNPDDRIVVIGVGGAGCKVIRAAVHQRIPGIELVAVDTDTVSRQLSDAPVQILIGRNLTRGLGAGGMTDLARRAAEESSDELNRVIQGAKAVIITCGLGGGTGAGAAPVIGRIAEELGAWTVAVVTTPFPFEGRRRKRQADEGLAELTAQVDTVIGTSNDRMLDVIDKKTTLAQAFLMVDQVLLKTIQGLAELITSRKMVKPELDDIRSILPSDGMASVMNRPPAGGFAREGQFDRPKIS